MTADELFLKICGRTVAEQAEAIQRWEEVEKPRLLKRMMDALLSPSASVRPPDPR